MNETEQQTARKGLILITATIMKGFNPTMDNNTIFEAAEAFEVDATARGLSIVAIIEGASS